MGIKKKPAKGKRKGRANQAKQGELREGKDRKGGRENPEVLNLEKKKNRKEKKKENKKEAKAKHKRES